MGRSRRNFLIPLILLAAGIFIVVMKVARGPKDAWDWFTCIGWGVVTIGYATNAWHHSAPDSDERDIEDKGVH